MPYIRQDRREKLRLLLLGLPEEIETVGDLAYVKEQITAWEAAGVTMMVVGARSPEQIRDLADLV